MKSRNILFSIIIAIAFVAVAFTATCGAGKPGGPEWERKYDASSPWLRLKGIMIRGEGNKSLSLRQFEAEYGSLLRKLEEAEIEWKNIGRAPTEEMEKRYREKVAELQNEISIYETSLLFLKKDVDCNRQFHLYMNSDGKVPIEKACLAEQ